MAPLTLTLPDADTLRQWGDGSKRRRGQRAPLSGNVVTPPGDSLQDAAEFTDVGKLDPTITRRFGADGKSYPARREPMPTEEDALRFAAEINRQRRGPADSW